VWNVHVSNGQTDFLQMLFVLQSVDVIDTSHVQRIVVGIVGTGDCTTGLSSTEYYLITFCATNTNKHRHPQTDRQTDRQTLCAAAEYFITLRAD